MFAASFNNRRILKSVATVTIGEQSVEVHALEVDPNGIALIATFNPPVGTEMLVAFVLSRAGRPPVALRLQTRVTHTILSRTYNGFRLNCSFIDPDPDSLLALQQFMH